MSFVCHARDCFVGVVNGWSLSQFWQEFRRVEIKKNIELVLRDICLHSPGFVLISKIWEAR